LMGFLPIAIGLKKLLDWKKDSSNEAENLPQKQSKGALQFLTVAAVTVSNGGDNIGVYVPLFANSTPLESIGLIIIFMLMVAVWCGIAFYLVRHSVMKHHIRRVGNFLLSFVLIGLGVYILAEAFLLHSP